MSSAGEEPVGWGRGRAVESSGETAGESHGSSETAPLSRGLIVGAPLATALLFLFIVGAG